MQQVLGDILPLALGIAISPIPIIAIILMLITPKARSNGLAFLVGWMARLAVVGGIALALANAVGLSPRPMPLKPRASSSSHSEPCSWWWRCASGAHDRQPGKPGRCPSGCRHSTRSPRSSRLGLCTAFRTQPQEPRPEPCGHVDRGCCRTANVFSGGCAGRGRADRQHRNHRPRGRLLRRRRQVSRGSRQLEGVACREQHNGHDGLAAHIRSDADRTGHLRSRPVKAGTR